MKQYLNILQNILDNGKEKLPFRKTEGRTLSNSTIGLPNVVFSHDMREGFPLLTTKKMGLKNIAVELEFFIKGLTSKKWLKDRNCHIWDSWANPVKVMHRIRDVEDLNSFLGLSSSDINQDEVKAEEDDLGPIYGFQWRTFNKTYATQNDDDGDFFKYFDQLKNIVDTLKTTPTDRRMVCSAWNPNQIEHMALPPCHLMWIVTVYDNQLHMQWTQRSVDTLLGLPYNIASYALLQCLLAKHAGLEPGNLTGMLVDCHLYDNQLEVAREQLTRETRNLPRLELPDNFDFWAWDHTQFKLTNYDPHPPLEKVAVVV
jgi:thymidylate synthase